MSNNNMWPKSHLSILVTLDEVGDVWECLLENGGVFRAECWDDVEHNILYTSLLLGVALLAPASDTQALDLSEKSRGTDGRSAILDTDLDALCELDDGFLYREKLRQLYVRHVEEGYVVPQGVQGTAPRGDGLSSGGLGPPLHQGHYSYQRDDDDQA